jgi:hypothetical protein
MPNWVEPSLEIVGRKADLDRFLKKTLLVPKSAAERERYGGPMFRFARACPPPKRERPTLVADTGAFALQFIDFQAPIRARVEVRFSF